MKQGWKKYKLHLLVNRLTNGYVGQTKNIYQDTGIPYLLARHVKNNVLTFDGRTFVSDEFNLKNKKSILKEGDVLLVQSGHIGHSAVVPKEHEGHNCHSMIVMTPKKNFLTGDFLSLYFFSPFMQQMFESLKTGSTIKHLNCKVVREINIALPSLAEQQRIVTIIGKAFTAITKAKANAEQNLKNAKELFESYLQGVFENGNWERKKIEDLTELVTKGSSPKWQGINYVDKPGTLFVTSENVGEGKLLMKKRKYLEEKFNDIQQKSILRTGDVLTNIVGASIGRTAIYELDELANINQAVCIMRCKDIELYNYYLMYLLNSPFFKAVLHDNEIDNARANLSLTFFKNLEIPLPLITEQRIIVDKIKGFSDKANRLEAIYQQKIKDLEELKKSVLQKAFNGELKLSGL
ncbi:MAG: hypothetical protein COC01_05410 [Bacteroidetes bacterium]|nr:MAG: hypothetical protein COC01_05410 [Bacteroidota bacterium]